MGNVQIGHIPRERTESGWFATLGDPPPARELEGTGYYDWLVVGGGWMGLHAAHRLADLRPDDRIALVDAGRIGNNAAGRCAGFALDVAPRPARRYNDVDVQRDLEEIHVNREGIDYIRHCIRRHAIRCDWNQQGKIHAAASPAGRRKLQSVAAILDRLGEDCEWLDARAMRETTGTAFHACGLYTPGAALLQPAAYLRELVGRLPDNVTVFENSPIREVEYGADEHWCRTPRGAIVAGQLLLATNAFLPQFGFYRRHAIPVYTYASLTRPLSRSELRDAGNPGEFGVVPANRFGTTLRRTADNRLFVRNFFAYAPRYRSMPKAFTKAIRYHHHALARRYPAIAPIGFEHSWGGILGLSANGGMVFGRVAKGVYATSFCNGIGVARGATFGKALAEYATGASSQTIEILRNRQDPVRTWPNPITRLGVGFVTAWRLKQARTEI